MTVHRRDFITGLVGATGVLATRSLAADGQATGSTSPRFMYVGSFTSPERGHGDGISVYAGKTVPGRGPQWSRTQLVKKLENPSFLILDAAQQFLYAVHSDGDRASAYRVDAATGQISLIGHQATGGTNGVHLSIDATGRYLVVANYRERHAGPAADQQGRLARCACGSGDPARHSWPAQDRTTQFASAPLPVDPSHKFVVVPDKGLDRIFVFRIDAARGKLVPADVPSVATRAGAGPRHVGFHPAKPFAYVINELDSTLTTYGFDSSRGVLKPLQRLSTVPATFTDNNTAAEVAVARSGRFVYGSNRGHDSIVIFAVDAVGGMVRPIGWEPTRGGMPRYFGLDPSDRYLYAANQTGDTVVVFRVSATTGKLAATGEVIKVGAPCTIAFKA